ncbi:RidA family protein [Mesorhizobium sp. M7A.F.Ca.US.006.01.1.1]|uniref:RidA family protein n=1 Tax=Mesorhizobium sp. M7A.F.Ca.US.006.01.1.1 TaxID=2496707 RepID=UPI001FE01525|nr:RidA family protein [Mesorhizobium sp. M7A.F.Ca.US.006.01.1.1]
MSQAIGYGNMVFVAGLTADEPGLDVGAQTRQILAKISALLAEVEADNTKILSAQIWMRDVGFWKQMNDEWTKWLGGAKPPVRATVQAAMVLEGYDVEIMVTAAR